MTVLYEDRVIDPNIPSSCKIIYDPPIPKELYMKYFQQLWALSECFDLIKEYERTMNIRYEFVVRARSDSNLTYIEDTLPLPNSSTILIPDENHFFGYNNQFAIGPVALMEKYMRRWHDLSKCYVRNIHAESFLKLSLDRLSINVQLVSNLSYAQQPHGKYQCH